MLPFRIKKWQFFIFIGFWFFIEFGGCSCEYGCCCCNDSYNGDYDWGKDPDAGSSEQQYKFAKDTKKSYFLKDDKLANYYNSTLVDFS